MDYATVENVKVEFEEYAEGSTSPHGKNSPNITFRLLMDRNSEGRSEQISLVTETRYCCSLRRL